MCIRDRQNTLKAETLSEETTCVKLSDFVGKKLQSNTGTLEFVSSDDGTVILQITEGTYYGTVQVFEFSRATENSFGTLTRNLLSGYIPSYTYGTAITGELNTRGNWNIKFTNSFGASFINNEYKILSDPSIGEPEKPTSHLFSLFGSGICLLGNTAYIHGTFESMESGKVLEEFDKIQWTSSNSSIAQVVKKPSCISDVANNTAAISLIAYWGLPSFNPVVMTCPTLLKMASQGGANAIGHGDILGSVEEGKKADLILVNIEQPHITPTQNLVNTIVDAANGHDVMDSIINGKLVMKNREVLTLDEERIRFEATQHMNKIIKRAY